MTTVQGAGGLHTMSNPGVGVSSLGGHEEQPMSVPNRLFGGERDKKSVLCF